MLTELYVGAPVTWFADEVKVEFPEGRISSHLVSPHTSAEDRARLRERLGKLLTRAGIRHP